MDFQRADYYRVLQVDPQAHQEVLRAAYRTLLCALGQHPDLGGRDQDARNIIEAYTTLSDPERRRAYDQWLRAHPTPPPAAMASPTLAPGVARWIRATMPEYRLAPRAPFARSFDLVLEGPGPLGARLYAKAFPPVTRALWPTIFVLCRAIRVARSGVLPSGDSVLVVTPRVEELGPFLEAAGHQMAVWAWNRLSVGVYTLTPPRMHAVKPALMSLAFRRLRAAAARLESSPAG